MNRFTSEQVQVAIAAHLEKVAMANADGYHFDVQDCKISEDGTLRVCIGMIGDNIDSSVAYDGTEADMTTYDTESLEYIADDILAGGPSYQGGTAAEVNEWVSRA